MSSAIASAVAFCNRSVSSALGSLVFVSFSSSLSPTLKGSCSATGEGSTVDKGCHLLCLLPADPVRLTGSGLRLMLRISSAPSWNETLRLSGVAGVGLKRSGLASGLVDRGWGAPPDRTPYVRNALSSLRKWCLPSESRSSSAEKSSPRT